MMNNLQTHKSAAVMKDQETSLHKVESSDMYLQESWVTVDGLRIKRFHQEKLGQSKEWEPGMFPQLFCV